MENIRMKQPAIFEAIYSKLSDKDTVTINKIKKLLTKSEYIDFKTYLRIFSKTLFRVYWKDLSYDKIRQIMVLRREFYIDDPTDIEEYNELIKYFESEEDYESCHKINNEHNKNKYNKINDKK